MQYPSSGAHRPSQNTICSSLPQSGGQFIQKDANGKKVAVHEISINQDLIIGRDPNKCNYVIDDPRISRKHLRVYTIIYENNAPTEVDILVYAEDLSQNGTYWNGSFIGKENGGFLLSDKDVLQLGLHVRLEYQSPLSKIRQSYFDLAQEREMALFSKDYIITDRLLGSGAFGRVFMAVDQVQRKQLACKMIDLQSLGLYSGRIPREKPVEATKVDLTAQLQKMKTVVWKWKKGDDFESRLNSYFREVQILSSISHPNIIGLENVFVTDSTIYIFEDLVTAGDLFSYLEWKQGHLEEVEAAVIVRQIVIALDFLHKNNIVHRDLKPDNILMTSHLTGSRIVLTDFGAARQIEGRRHRMETMVGTEEYVAPEVINPPTRDSVGYTRAVDLWSLGCVTVVLLTGGSAFADPETNIYSERLAAACNLEHLQKTTEWHKVRSRPRDFVQRLLVLNERMRMTAKEALDHDWFSNDLHKVEFKKLYQRSVKGWKPRPQKDKLIQFVNSVRIKNLSCSRALLKSSLPPPRLKGKQPVEPPYRPFSRQMHLPFWPTRKPGQFGFTAEVQKAIKENWPQTKTGKTERTSRDLPLRSSLETTSISMKVKSVKNFTSLNTYTTRIPKKSTGSTRPQQSKQTSFLSKLKSAMEPKQSQMCATTNEFIPINRPASSRADERCDEQDGTCPTRQTSASVELKLDSPSDDRFTLPSATVPNSTNIENVKVFTAAAAMKSHLSGAKTAPEALTKVVPGSISRTGHLQHPLPFPSCYNFSRTTSPSAQPHDSPFSDRYSSSSTSPMSSPSPAPRSRLKRPSLADSLLPRPQSKKRRIGSIFDFDISEDEIE